MFWWNIISKIPSKHIRTSTKNNQKALVITSQEIYCFLEACIFFFTLPFSFRQVDQHANTCPVWNTNFKAHADFVPRFVPSLLRNKEHTVWPLGLTSCGQSANENKANKQHKTNQKTKQSKTTQPNKRTRNQQDRRGSRGAPFGKGTLSPLRRYLKPLPKGRGGGVSKEPKPP